MIFYEFDFEHCILCETLENLSSPLRLRRVAKDVCSKTYISKILKLQQKLRHFRKDRTLLYQ